MVMYNIRGENIEVTPAIRDYVERKVGKIEKYFKKEQDAQAHVNLKTYSDKTAKVEVTIPLPYVVLRAEETTEDLYGSVDLVADKLERQIRKYKTKVNRKSRKKDPEDVPTAVDPVLWGEVEETEDDGTAHPTIVRTKSFSLKPMGAEEAVLQMEMLGHDFFVYEDAETGETNIVYRRKDDQYGLIETD